MKIVFEEQKVSSLIKLIVLGFFPLYKEQNADMLCSFLLQSIFYHGERIQGQKGHFTWTKIPTR